MGGTTFPCVPLHFNHCLWLFILCIVSKGSGFSESRTASEKQASPKCNKTGFAAMTPVNTAALQPPPLPPPRQPLSRTGSAADLTVDVKLKTSIKRSQSSSSLLSVARAAESGKLGYTAVNPRIHDAAGCTTGCIVYTGFYSLHRSGKC